MKTDNLEGIDMKILLEPHRFSYFGQMLEIEAWFAFDGASVPQFALWLFKPNDNNLLRRALEHDFLYSKCSVDTNRKKADKHFAQEQKPYIVRLLTYLWVRAWGWIGYKRDLNYNKHKVEIDKYRKLNWIIK